MSIQIDYLFPWVNPLDIEWQKAYAKAKGEDIKQNDPRFRDLGWLKYMLRSLDKNMPWLHKVHIILASPSQVPDWLNTNEVNIIYHKDFIPENYLPVFNSSTIEVFLPKIECLSDYIIYGNDDLFAINHTEPTDFFTEDGIPKIFYREFKNPKGKFFQMCKRDSDLVKHTNIDDTYIKQEHLNVSWTKSALKEVYSKYEKVLLESITKFRTNLKNYNQYIFADYLIYNNNVVKLDSSSNIGKYHGLEDPSAGELTKFLNDPITKTVCINDSGTNNKVVLEEITHWLERKFPEKSKFEK